jgi:hypothetical protein
MVATQSPPPRTDKLIQSTFQYEIRALFWNFVQARIQKLMEIISGFITGSIPVPPRRKKSMEYKVCDYFLIIALNV